MVVAYYPEASAEARAALAPKSDLRYGPGPKETLDLFLPAGRPRGTFVFLHGGYWRAFDKSDFSFVAPPFVAQGYAVAVVNYDLCPDVSIATIVDECRRAVAWVVRDGAAHGANSERVVVGGHSAGGHLTAMLFATDWATHGFRPRPDRRGACRYPAFTTSRRWCCSRTTATSGSTRPKPRGCRRCCSRRGRDAPLLLAAGADETSEFVRQTQILWDAWPRNRPGRCARRRCSSPTATTSTSSSTSPTPNSELTRATLALF